MRSSSTIVFVGRSGVGKSTVARLFAQRFRLPLVEVGAQVREDSASCCQDPLSHADHVFEEGQTQRFIAAAVAQAPTRSVIVGPRLRQEIEFLHRWYSEVVVVGLLLDEQRRTVRCLRRFPVDIRPSVALRLQQERDRIEQSWGLDLVIKQADHHLAASSSADVVSMLSRILMPGVDANEF